MVVGYARVSTDGQDESLQIDALKAAGCERIYVDRASGAIRERPELTNALRDLRGGEDILVVWRLDRIGRSLRHLVDLVGDLRSRKIGFRSLNDPIDTISASGRLVFRVFAALAEFERDLTRERTTAGLAEARARGRVGGRPRVMTPEKLRLARRLYDEGEASQVACCGVDPDRRSEPGSDRGEHLLAVATAEARSHERGGIAASGARDTCVGVDGAARVVRARPRPYALCQRPVRTMQRPEISHASGWRHPPYSGRGAQCLRCEPNRARAEQTSERCQAAADHLTARDRQRAGCPTQRARAAIVGGRQQRMIRGGGDAGRRCGSRRRVRSCAVRFHRV